MVESPFGGTIVGGCEDLGTFVARWDVCDELACRFLGAMELVAATTEVRVVSGRRTVAEQLRLRAEGIGTTPELSNHVPTPPRGCAEALDFAPVVPLSVLRRLWDSQHPDAAFDPAPWWRFVGQHMELQGLRWGGGSPRIEGLPTDPGHVDLGPKSGRA